ncbi:transposase [Streptomyces achromogenes]|uniref:transposase n=1 Tax=Streptomyces achromogenes TaxID=67255 RepID=UPI003F4D42B6
MSGDLVLDDQSARVAPLLPQHPERRHRYAGRHQTPGWSALAGILCVLRTGVTWRDMPCQVVGCSGITTWPPAGLGRGRPPAPTSHRPAR